MSADSVATCHDARMVSHVALSGVGAALKAGMWKISSLKLKVSM